jgi:hypothetical protein
MFRCSDHRADSPAMSCAEATMRDVTRLDDPAMHVAVEINNSGLLQIHSLNQRLLPYLFRVYDFMDSLVTSITHSPFTNALPCTYEHGGSPPDVEVLNPDEAKAPGTGDMLARSHCK